MHKSGLLCGEEPYQHHQGGLTCWKQSGDESESTLSSVAHVVGAIYSYSACIQLARCMPAKDLINKGLLLPA